MLCLFNQGFDPTAVCKYFTIAHVFSFEKKKTVYYPSIQQFSGSFCKNISFQSFESVKLNSTIVFSLILVFRKLVNHKEVCSRFRETYSEFCQTSEIVRFEKIVNS